VKTLFADRLIILAMLASLFGFGSAMAWISFVELAEGVAVDGKIVVESERQVIQHLEGGIAQEVLVSEGDTVEVGTPVIVLADANAKAVRNALIDRVATLAATKVRLESLGGDLPFRPQDAWFDLPLSDDQRNVLVLSQTQAYNDQRASFLADISVQQGRQEAADERVAIKQRELSSAKLARDAVGQELSLARQLLSEQMETVDRVRSLEREAAQMASEIARLETDISAAMSEAQEALRQEISIRSRFNADLASELVSVRAELEEARQQLDAAQDTIDRYTLFAPRSGKVINVRYNTVGGVVRPGDAVMEIVPNKMSIFASVRVRPSDRAQVSEGQVVRATVSALREWQRVPTPGEVVTVSADLKSDEQSGQSFYEVRVRLIPSGREDLANLNVAPGMPVQVFIYSGRKRTTLDYLMTPIRESLGRGLRGAA